MSIIYLASPYTSKESLPAKVVNEMQSRFEAALAHVNQSLLDIPYATVYSPIVHYHALAEFYSLPKSFDFWRSHNEDMMCVAAELWVLTLPGWEDSTGVQSEIAYMKELGKPILYKEPI